MILYKNDEKLEIYEIPKLERGENFYLYYLYIIK